VRGGYCGGEGGRLRGWGGWVIGEYECAWERGCRVGEVPGQRRGDAGREEVERVSP